MFYDFIETYMKYFNYIPFVCTITISAQQSPTVAIYVTGGEAKAVASVPVAVNTNVISTQSENKYPDFYAATKQVTSFLDTLCTSMRNHWFLTTTVATVGVYGIVLLFLLKEQYYFADTQRLCQWQAPLTLQELCAYPHDKLQELLIKYIAAQYINPQKPTDTIWPLTQFMIAFQKEEYRIKRYLKIVNCLQATQLSRLFPPLHEVRAKEYLDRLAFMYHIFTAWTAHLTWEAMIDGKRNNE
jgi:hypothetical protein